MVSFSNSRLCCKLTLVSVVLLCLLSYTGRPYNNFALAKATFEDLQLPPKPDYPPTQEQRQRFVALGANDIVHEIWSALRSFDPTWSEKYIGITSRPTAFLDMGWYYVKLAFRTLFMNTPTPKTDDDRKISGDLQKAVYGLTIAADFSDPDALLLLGDMNLYGNFSHPRNPKEAFKWYSRLAELDGNSTAQYVLGLLYATGIGGIVPDQAKAMLYHNFAAEQGNVRSEMTLAFRHHAGIGTPRNCNRAVEYYKRVADKAMAFWQSGPPGGLHFTRNSYRWVEVSGGAYGEGASASSSGHNAPNPHMTVVDFEDMLEYLDMQERQGNYHAILQLGKHFYEPPRGYKRNVRRAQRQFMKIAKVYWTKDGKINPKGPKGIDKVAGKAAAYIGRMFLRGEGMEQNFDKAKTWFHRGIANGDSFAQYHMGLMYRDGLGVPKDGAKAGAYLKAAAEQSYALAHSALGVLFLDQGDIETAGRYFELAAGSGVMEGFYYLAELTNKGIGRERNCGLATVYYKVVAERAESLHSSLAEANAAYERGDFDRAFIPTLMAAEQGYENAQANVAHLLDQKTAVISLPALPIDIPFLHSVLPSKSKRSRLLSNAALALVYYTRAAKQTNIDALVKMGDFYLSGLGTDNSTPELEKATSCYTAAAEGHHSAQALWNLGWMHENGVGSVSQDFHMAKRYYDLALEMNKEAYLPVKLALVKLRLRSWWNGVSGGKINPIGSEEDADEKKGPRSLTEWIARFLDAAEEMDAQEAAELQRRFGGEGDEVFGEPGMPGGDEDYASPARTAGGGEAGVYGTDEWDDLDDGLVESLIIVALAGMLALLVYARQRRQREVEEERRRGLGQGQGVAGTGADAVGADGAGAAAGGVDAAGRQGGGFFPQPWDPEHNNWVAGGVGH